MHPDVVQNHGCLDAARFLMVMEPYPWADSRYENPSVVSSDDGLCWAVPDTIINPVVPPPSDGWHSDADLLLESDGRLAIYYRYNSGRGETALLRTEYREGGVWGAPQRLFSVPVSGRFASPALVRLRGRLHLFYVDTVGGTVKALQSSDNGMNWTADRSLLTVPGAWHVDAFEWQDACYLLLTDQNSLYLFRSVGLDSWALHSHEDGWTSDPTVWLTVESRRRWRVLGPATNSWDNARIYRASGFVEEGCLRVWYSAYSHDNEWRIGYTDGTFTQ